MKSYWLGLFGTAMLSVGVVALGFWIFGNTLGWKEGVWIDHFKIAGPIMGVFGAIFWIAITHELTA